jgi:hypothetical protein
VCLPLRPPSACGPTAYPPRVIPHRFCAADHDPFLAPFDSAPPPRPIRNPTPPRVASSTSSPAAATVSQRHHENDGIPRLSLLPPPPSNRIILHAKSPRHRRCLSHIGSPSTPPPPHRIATALPRAGTTPSPPIHSDQRCRLTLDLLPSARIDDVARHRTR